MHHAPHGPLIISLMRLSLAHESQAEHLQEEGLLVAIQRSQTYKVTQNYPQSCPKFDEVKNFSILPGKGDLACQSPTPCTFPALSWGSHGQIGCLWQRDSSGEAGQRLLWFGMPSKPGELLSLTVLTSSPQTCWDPCGS